MIKQLLILLFSFSLLACADRPSFTSVKKAMKQLEQHESLPGIVEVKHMHKLSTLKKHDLFVVEIYFEQLFLVDVLEAAQLTAKTIEDQNPKLMYVQNEHEDKRDQFFQRLIAEKYGAFNKGDKRRRYVELVFRKEEKQWFLLEQRKHWKDFDLSLFPKSDVN